VCGSHSTGGMFRVFLDAVKSEQSLPHSCAVQRNHIVESYRRAYDDCAIKTFKSPKRTAEAAPRRSYSRHLLPKVCLRFYRGRTRAIAASRRASSTGLVTCSPNPASALAFLSSSIPNPLRQMPGISGRFPRRRRIKSRPLSSGKPRSEMTKS